MLIQSEGIAPVNIKFASRTGWLAFLAAALFLNMSGIVPARSRQITLVISIPPSYVVNLAP